MYNRILDLRIATPQIIINFATFLEEHRYFEEAFKVSCQDRHYSGLLCVNLKFNIIYKANRQAVKADQQAEMIIG